MVAISADGRLGEDNAVHGDRSSAIELKRKILRSKGRAVDSVDSMEAWLKLCRTVSMARTISLALALTLSMTLALAEELTAFELLKWLVLCGI
jgi:hypothetical protein